MESNVDIEQVSRRAFRSAVGLPVCPHCGGNVRKIRDIYGAYLQCLQCSREIQPAATAPTHSIEADVVPLERHANERMIA